MNFDISPRKKAKVASSGPGTSEEMDIERDGASGAVSGVLPPLDPTDRKGKKKAKN